MASLLKMTDATALALHAMVYLAERSADGKLVTKVEIAASLSVSEGHLSKVLQRLVHEGLVRSIRGPNGGFALAKQAEEVTLRDVYETLEGGLRVDRCLYPEKTCNRARCILGGLVEETRKSASAYFSRTTLRDLVDGEIRQA